MTFIPDERDYEAAKKDPAFARASDANKYRLAFVEQMIRLFGAMRRSGWHARRTRVAVPSSAPPGDPADEVGK